MIVVTCRVVERGEWISLHAFDGRRTEFTAQFGKIVGICAEAEFIFVDEAVQTDVLRETRAAVVVKSIGQGVLSRDTSPHGRLHELVIAVDGNTVLIALQAIFKYIFRDFSEIQIKISTLKVVIVGVKEWRKHPELDIFDVRCIEVGVVHLTHDASPPAFGIEKIALVIDICRVKVVGSAFCRVE